uniref:Uncharacterized protein n=1 Tax=Anguilla anguilla TaxID=7936 RepID=A0A0E9XLS4_ANGAN
MQQMCQHFLAAGSTGLNRFHRLNFGLHLWFTFRSCVLVHRRKFQNGRK